MSLGWLIPVIMPPGIPIPFETFVNQGAKENLGLEDEEENGIFDVNRVVIKNFDGTLTKKDIVT